MLFFYDGWQCAEETDSSGTLPKHYVQGEGTDEVIKGNVPPPASTLTGI